MSYKTILVCLTTTTNAERLTKIAADVARKFNAHLIGLHTLQSLIVYPGIALPLSADTEATFRESQHREAEEIRKVFEQHTKSEDFVAEWRCVEARSETAADRIVEHARCADLVIMQQSDREHDRPDQVTIQRQVIEQSGRPVLVVPTYGQFDVIGENILVGWSATREATRSVHDAIPFMRQAKTVNILWVSENKSRDTYLSQTAGEMAAALDRNGVKANVSHRVSSGLPIGDEILNEATDTGADLIVSGAYGHSRVYDFVMGATTPHLLEHMTEPVLFSC